jgi:hypothetical protein
MNNTGGSFALLGAMVPEDSTLAAKLRASGAIILGKYFVFITYAILAEFMCFTWDM